MKLFKILNAIDRGSRLLSEEKLKFHGSTQLERYANSVLSSKTLAHDINIKEGRATIGGHQVENVSRKLKLGDVGVLNKIYRINEIPRALALRTLEDVKNLPSARVGEVERLQTTFKEKARNKLSAKAYDELNSTGRDLKIDDVRENDLIKKVVDEIMTKRDIKPFTGTGFVVAGVSMAIFISTFNKRLRDMKGCHVYYTDDLGNISSCKLAACSCDGKGGFNSECGVHCKLCPEEILRLLPLSMTDNIKACANATGPCVNCPSTEFENANAVDIDSENPDFNNTLPTDKLYIKCVDPTILDTFVDIFGNLGNDILDIADNAVGATNFFLRNIKSILVASGVIVTIIAMFVAYMKFGRPVPLLYSETNKK